MAIPNRHSTVHMEVIKMTLIDRLVIAYLKRFRTPAPLCTKDSLGRSFLVTWVWAWGATEKRPVLLHHMETQS